MKILWVKSDFLHPTERGGQIRTLEMLRRLHQRHEVHYVALANSRYPEGPARATEYCSFAYPLAHDLPPQGTAAFLWQLIASVISPLPLSISRYRSAAMRRQLTDLLTKHTFDAVVCDFVFPAQNLPHLDQSFLFQHNVETLIWRRHAANPRNLFKRIYFRMQAARMFRHERAVCRAVKQIVTVSEADAQLTRELFDLSTQIAVVPTGVDCDYFAPPPAVEPFCDLIFIGAMDWMPNIDGVLYFVREIWPKVQAAYPNSTLGIVGRSPFPEIRRLAEDPRIKVTGTVPDIRPYLWGSSVSIVPLRIGGGTRLKIYESMAAGVPVVSTGVGAEGLPVEHPTHIRLADTPDLFAAQCGQLLSDQAERSGMAARALEWVASSYSWETVVRCFEKILAGA